MTRSNKKLAVAIASRQNNMGIELNTLYRKNKLY